jgi:hypothetical protein
MTVKGLPAMTVKGLQAMTVKGARVGARGRWHHTAFLPP